MKTLSKVTIVIFSGLLTFWAKASETTNCVTLFGKVSENHYLDASGEKFLTSTSYLFKVNLSDMGLSIALQDSNTNATTRLAWDHSDFYYMEYGSNRAPANASIWKAQLPIRATPLMQSMWLSLMHNPRAKVALTNSEGVFPAFFGIRDISRCIETTNAAGENELQLWGPGFYRRFEVPTPYSPPYATGYIAVALTKPSQFASNEIGVTPILSQVKVYSAPVEKPGVGLQQAPALKESYDITFLSVSNYQCEIGSILLPPLTNSVAVLDYRFTENGVTKYTKTKWLSRKDPEFQAIADSIKFNVVPEQKMPTYVSMLIGFIAAAGILSVPLIFKRAIASKTKPQNTTI